MYDQDAAERHQWEANEEQRARRSRRTLDLTCPTCKTPNALSPREAARGYQCTRCADSEEGCF